MRTYELSPLFIIAYAVQFLNFSTSNAGSAYEMPA
jgi:hypothetical protein